MNIEDLIKEISNSINQYKDNAPTYLEYLKTRKGMKGDELSLTITKNSLESARLSAIGAVVSYFEKIKEKENLE